MKEVKVVIAGVGVVGSNVVNSLTKKRDYFLQRFGVDIKIVGISSRTKKAFAYKWYNDPIEMIDQENPDVVCELIGGDSGVADEIARKVLSSSKTLITANKALLAKSGTELMAIAKANNAKLYFEAAVGGAVPIIQMLSSNLNYNEIDSFQAILNGTANYIMTVMHNEKRDLASVISVAQKLGLAESDPSFDICGIDASQKLAIMNSLIYNVGFSTEKLQVTGIDKISLSDIKAAEYFGSRIKLVAKSELIGGVLYSRVAPVFCTPKNFLYSIEYAINAASFKTDMATDMTLVSHGAGGIQTAHAVLSDIQGYITGAIPPSCNIMQQAADYRAIEFAGDIVVKAKVKQEVSNAQAVQIDDSYYYLVKATSETKLAAIFGSDITCFLFD